MQNWDDIRYFLAVTRTGSFLKASESLSVNASTVARRIEQLEEKIKSSLFDRHRHGMVPTAMGRRLLDQAYEMEQAAKSMDDILAENDLSEKEVITISMTDGLGTIWLIPKLGSFQTACPNTSLNLRMDQETVDLAQGEADIALRLFEPKDPHLEYQKVGIIRFQVFAAPVYLNRMGIPRDWADLSAHKIVSYAGYEDSRVLKLWQETVNHHDRVVLKTNSSQSYVCALQQGLGLGLLPRFYRHAVTDLVALDLDTDLFEMPIYVVSHDQLKENQHLQMVKKHLVSLFEQDHPSWFS